MTFLHSSVVCKLFSWFDKQSTSQMVSLMAMFRGVVGSILPRCMLGLFLIESEKVSNFEGGDSLRGA